MRASDGVAGGHAERAAAARRRRRRARRPRAKTPAIRGRPGNTNARAVGPGRPCVSSPARAGSYLLELALERAAGLEGHGLLGRDLHRLARARVAAHAGLPLTDDEAAE